MTIAQQACTNMIKQQLRTCEVLDENLLSIIANTGKDKFVPKEFAHLAYSEYQIPLQHQQVMMTPQQESRMLQELAITADDTVLEIGTGSGYVTALLAQLGSQVTSIDIFTEFTQQAQRMLQELKLNNVNFLTEDITKTISKHGPHDVIAITAAMEYVPQSYKQQLTPNGRLFVIQGMAPARTATLITRIDNNNWVEKKLLETDIIPLVGGPTKHSFEI